MKKNRVLNVYNSLYDGGTEKYILMLMDALDPDRYEKHVCCLVERGPLAELFEQHGIKVHSLRANNKPSLLNYFKNIPQIIKLAVLIRKLKIDIIHTHDFFPAFITRSALLLAGKRTVYVTMHNMQSWLSGIHHRINRFYAKRTTKIICVSKSVEQFSKQHDRISDDKYLTILNGIDIQQYKPDSTLRDQYRQEFNIQQNHILIGNIGSFSFRKGQQYLLEAVNILKNDFPLIRVIIVGGERPQEPGIKPELEKLIEKLKITEHVIFAGNRNDAIGLINSFDIYVMSSITEGLSLASLEGMLMEKPVIYSDIGPFKEVVEHCKTGYLFRSTDSSDLAEKIKHVILHREESILIAKNARNYVVEHHDRKNMLEKYRELYTIRIN